MKLRPSPRNKVTNFLSVIAMLLLVISFWPDFFAAERPESEKAPAKNPSDEELLVDPDFYAGSTWTVDRIEMLASGVDAKGYGVAAWGTFFKRDLPPIKEIQIMNVSTIYDNERAIGLTRGDQVRLFKNDWDKKPRILQKGDFRIVPADRKTHNVDAMNPKVDK